MRRWLPILVLFLTGITHAQVANAFGFSCGNNNSSGCFTSGTYHWPTSTYVPKLWRWWDNGVYWSNINTANGTYSWGALDQLLDLVAANNAQAIYTIGWTPFWDAPTTPSSCQSGSHGSACPPSDLNSSGSATFNTFVTALVQHTSANGHAFATYVKYVELWNEPEDSTRWTGTATQLYQMMAPAVTIIKANITGVKILSPPIPNVSGAEAWQCGYLAQEVANGIISDIYSVHGYWQNATPESKFNGTPFQNQLAPNINYSSACSASGWTKLPMWNTETNYANSSTGNPYVCLTSTYSAADCAGQPVRWQLLTMSNGFQNVDWYSWYLGVGSVTLNDTDYGYMMNYLTGGTMGSACTNPSGTTWVCGFTEANGATAQWVWTTSETTGQTYTVPASYKDYLDLHGGKTSVTPGNNMTITVEPVMLEQPLAGSGNWNGPPSYMD
jgi:hypothetical protein